jgi:hypothetical protein
MLEPDDRHLLVDALRPPEGSSLDLAVATTFTLDLDALLVAPLAFALYDWATDTEGRPDPLALLEALRRHADRLTVFCQAGEIGFRNDYRPLLVLVEDSVVPVAAPNPGGIFHPKLWVLRFVDEEARRSYRVLVPSRNLTFDRSWDSLLVLEGVPEPEPVQATSPLADLVAALPALATRPISQRRQDEAIALAEELRSVRFSPPEGFDRVVFHPMGLGAGSPLRASYDRVLVVSPFVTAGTLSRLATTGSGHVLVSDPDALAGVGRQGLRGFSETFVLTSAALPGDGQAGPEDVSREAVGRPELDGLHAKLYVLERGQRASLYTGSANATDAAFNTNVELLVELTAPRGQLGIDQLLAIPDEGTSFRTLLEEHRPADDEPAEPTAAEQLVVDLDRLQRALGQLRYTLELTPETGSEDLRATLTAFGDVPESIDDLRTLEVWPITRGGGHAVALRREGGRLVAELGRLSPDGVTAFLAIRAGLERAGLREETTFVVTALLHGAPAGRAERVLTTMLRDPDALLRYLLLLLADAELDLQALLDAMSADGFGAGTRFVERVTPPLLETMLRALTNDPNRFDHVARLVADLRSSAGGGALLPDGFEDIWEPIWQVRQELSG